MGNQGDNHPDSGTGQIKPAQKFFLTYTAQLANIGTMSTSSVSANFDFYFWYGFSFRPSARVKV